MEAFIEQSVLETLSKGSLEAYSDGIAAAASEKLGEDVSLFATHKTHAYGIAGERVVKVTWERTSEGTSVQVEDADVSVITEKNVDTFVAKTLRQTVEDLVDGRGGEARNRLHLLALHIEDDGQYWVSDGIAMVKGLGDSPVWLEQYIESKDSIREAVDDADAIERRMPRTPYSRIPSESLSDFRAELYDSLKQIKNVLGGLKESVGVLDFPTDPKTEGYKHGGVALALAKEALVVESLVITKSIDTVLRLAQDEDIYEIAEYHDNLAERGKAMVVLSAFLASLKTGEDDNARKS